MDNNILAVFYIINVIGPMREIRKDSIDVESNEGHFKGRHIQ